MTTFLLHALANSPAALAAPSQDLDDSEIHAAILSELAADDGVSARDIDVTVDDGIVELSGVVDNLLAHDRAPLIASMVKGVRSVVNRTAVRPTAKTDQELRNDVEASLRYDPTTESYEIDVDVDEGKATLTGAVDSWAERDLADKVASSVAGVEEVRNRIAVDYVGERRDTEIQEEIEDALMWDRRIDAALIDVDVRNGRVRLTGTVGSDRERELATRAAWVIGVDDVNAKKLDVEWWARDDRLRKDPANLADSEIRSAIADAMARDPRVLSFNPNVAVNNGSVTLTGSVDSVIAKRAAEDIARNTVGVWRVSNYLTVRTDAQLSDAEVESRVNAAIARDPYLDRSEITTSVWGGDAYLYGTVDSSFDRRWADDVVASVDGVEAVHNQLTAIPTADTTDWRDPYLPGTRPYLRKDDFEMAEDVRAQLWWSPFVDTDEIAVNVDEGEVRLTGTVDTLHERRMAGVNAYQGGAVSVDNDLKVDGSPDWLIGDT